MEKYVLRSGVYLRKYLVRRRDHVLQDHGSKGASRDNNLRVQKGEAEVLEPQGSITKKERGEAKQCESRSAQRKRAAVVYTREGD